jgi:hypothetical protein
MVTQVGYSVAGRSRGQVAMCAVCTVHIETRSAGFLVEPQIQGRQFVSGLISKPLGRFLSGLVSKLLGRFLPVWPQNQWYGFPRFDLKTGGDNFLGLASKPRVTVFRFGHQTSRCGLVICASKSSQRFLTLDLKTKQTSVYRLCHKTDGGRTAWDTHRDLAACFT